MPAPLPDRPVEESQDVEMTDAPTAVKTPEKVASAVPEKPSSPAGTSALASTSVSHTVEAPKEEVPEPISAPEAPKPEASQLEAPKPADTTAVPTNACPVLDLPVQQSGVAADGADNQEEIGSEKPTESSAQPPEAPPSAEAPAEPPTAQPAEAVAKKAEEAEDAAVKMLASNLDAPANGTPSGAAEPEEPAAEAGPQSDRSPVTGEKRKADADADAEANGDASSKKVNLEATPPAPTTNGSPPARKPGRPKKEKKQPAPVGKTARRTRSQGASADV